MWLPRSSSSSPLSRYSRQYGGTPRRFGAERRECPHCNGDACDISCSYGAAQHPASRPVSAETGMESPLPVSAVCLGGAFRLLDEPTVVTGLFLRVRGGVVCAVLTTPPAADEEGPGRSECTRTAHSDVTATPRHEGCLRTLSSTHPQRVTRLPTARRWGASAFLSARTIPIASCRDAVSVRE